MAFSFMASAPPFWRQNDLEGWLGRWEKQTAAYDPAGWQAHGLGENWAPTVDATTGATYWWHKVTRETRWATKAKKACVVKFAVAAALAGWS